MNINITVWPGLTDNYFIFALPDFQLSGRKGNLFDYFEPAGLAVSGEYSRGPGRDRLRVSTYISSVCPTKNKPDSRNMFVSFNVRAELRSSVYYAIGARTDLF